MRITGVPYERKAFPLTIIVYLISSLFISVSAATNSPGLGEIMAENDMVFAPHATYVQYTALHPVQGREQAFAIQFNPRERHLMLVSSYGENLYGGDSLTRFMQHTQKEGYVVVGGINGDGYNVNTGVPDGPMIHDGRLVAAPDSDTCVGFTSDGEAVIGPLRVGIYLNLPSEDVKINHFNKDMGTDGCYLFSAEFADTTKSTVLTSYDVICEITGGRQALNDTLAIRVVDVKDDARDTPIGLNRLVIAIAKMDSNQAGIERLKTLRKGDTLSVAIRDECTTVGVASCWPLVREAIGSLSVILQDGQVVTSDTNIHPRTCFGLKPDGTVVLFVVDGRQPGYSTGMNLVDVAGFLREQGCKDAVNLDGGGSSAIAAREPGNSFPTILNKPSDGGERSDGNALVLVASPEGDGIFAHLHIKPVTALVLAGAQVNFTLQGTDNAYRPTAIPHRATWSVPRNSGTIVTRGTDGGLYTAGAASADGTIEVAVNGQTATATVQVVRDAEFKFNVTSLTLNPGQTFDINVAAFRNGVPVICQDHQFNWRVEGDIGSIDQNGLFVAAKGSGLTGRVIAQLGSRICALNVNVGKLPVVVADFEDGFAGWVVKAARLPVDSQHISEESGPEYVRFGQKSLKLEYDMTAGAPGIAGIYLSAVSQPEIEGYPTAIGMWVYGDGKGHWLRGQLRDGAGTPIDLDYTAPRTGVDWVGWRYVESPIPQGRMLPLKIDLPVRCIETDNQKRTAGVLYIDNIRLIYGVKNDDLTPPAIAEITPAAGTTLTRYTNIRVQVRDDESGIDPAQIWFYIDGQLKTDSMYNAAAGNVQWNTRGLNDGEHQFTLKIKDRFGNETVRNWVYIWDSRQ